MIHNAPLVTIICVTYNHEKYIAQTIDSFLAQQTNFLIEIVVHDDASTDKTQEILKTYSTYKYIRAILEKDNQLSKNGDKFFTDMFKNAQGKYIALCEGDDFWTDPLKLQKQVDFMESHPSHALCFHPVRVFFENGEEPDSVFPASNERNFTTQELLKQNYIQTNSVLYRKQNYDRLCHDMIPMDWYLHLFHAQFGKIGFLTETMSAYRRHTGGMWWNSYENQEKIWRKNGVSQVAMFDEILKIYGSNKSYARILDGNVAYLLEQFIDLDRKYHEHLFDKVLAKFPMLVKEFAAGQLDNIRELDRQRMHNAALLSDAQARLDLVERRLAPLRRVDPRRAKHIYHKLKRTR